MISFARGIIDTFIDLGMRKSWRDNDFGAMLAIANDASGL
jgi:hypothetical protein